MKIQHSGGTGTSSCLVHKTMNYQIDKKTKTNIQTNKPAYQRPTRVLFLLQLLLLDKFSLLCVVGFFAECWGVVMMTNWHYFIQSSFTLHSLPFELCSISLSLESLLYHLFLRQSSITVHIRRSTHLLLFHNALFIIRKASLEGYLFQASGQTKGRKITS